MAQEYLDKTGLIYFWNGLKQKFQPMLVSGTNIKTVDGTSVLGSGNIHTLQCNNRTATLTTSGWNNFSQTVTVSGVTSSNTVTVSPAPSSIDDWVECEVFCISQATNQLTFSCKSLPLTAISVNIMILE